MTNFNEHSVFGDNFKYVLALALLTAMTYSSGPVRDALAAGGAYRDQPSAWTFASSTIRREPSVGRPPQALGTSTESSFWRNPAEARRELAPEQVVTLLYKQGIIPADKLAAARALVAQYQHLENATTTRRMPPMPLAPGSSQGTSTNPFHGDDGSSSPHRGFGGDLRPR